MIGCLRALLLLALALLGAPQGAPLRAQSIAMHDRPALDSLARAAARASVRFADRAVAARSGYRRIGPDFPGMGEHWLHPGALLAGKLDAEQPTILIFATIAGVPRLLGVGFVTTTRGAEPAVGVPGWPEAWHEHSGLLADESGVSPGTGAPSDTHVWVLHAWTALENPGGAYAPDNWSLPFVRAGIEAPARQELEAARALALATTGDRYLLDLLTDAGLRTPSNAAQIDDVVARSSAQARVVADRARAAHLLSADDVAALRAEWSALEQSLRAALGPDVERYLAPPHSAMHSGEHQAARR